MYLATLPDSNANLIADSLTNLSRLKLSKTTPSLTFSTTASLKKSFVVSNRGKWSDTKSDTSNSLSKSLQISIPGFRAFSAFSLK